MASPKIFLSAGIPPKGRQFYEATNKAAVTSAVMAFTRVCAEYNIPFYFGGQPAITPLIWSVAKDFSDSIKDLITIYQSAIFQGKTPKEALYFKNICWTAANGKDIQSNIINMRNKMFGDNPQTKMAVFIGGSDGILDEYERIREYIPKVRIISLKSVGGASTEVYLREGCNDNMLESSFAYYHIFKKLLKSL